MAGGTSAFNMITSIRNNLSLKQNRRKMQENPFLGPRLDRHAHHGHLQEGIYYRIERKQRLQRFRLFAFLGLIILAVIVLLVAKFVAI
jgi:hypothetical protein